MKNFKSTYAAFAILISIALGCTSVAKEKTDIKVIDDLQELLIDSSNSKMRILEVPIDSIRFRYKFVTPDTIFFFNDTMYHLAPQQHHYMETNGKFVRLKQGHGSDTWNNTIVNLQTGEHLTYEFAYAVDLDEHLVCYWKRPWPKKEIVVENFISHKEQIIRLNETCGSAFLHYCLSVDSLSNRTLYYRWDKDFDPQNKRQVKLKINV